MQYILLVFVIMHEPTPNIASKWTIFFLQTWNIIYSIFNINYFQRIINNQNL